MTTQPNHKRLDASYAGTSLSHGTLRDEDLLAAFVPFLLNLNSFTVNRTLVQTFGIPIRLLADICWKTFVAESDPDDLAGLVNEELFDLLNAVAPKGCWFGSHEGDGSDFGFWTAYEDDCEDDCEDDLQTNPRSNPDAWDQADHEGLSYQTNPRSNPDAW